MRDIGGVFGGSLPARLQRRRHSLANLEETLEAQGFEEDVEEEEVVIPNTNPQLRLQLTQRQYQRPDVQIRRRRRRTQGNLHVRAWQRVVTEG